MKTRLLRAIAFRAHHLLLKLVQLCHVSEKIFRVVNLASLLAHLAWEINTGKFFVTPHPKPMAYCFGK